MDFFFFPVTHPIIPENVINIHLSNCADKTFIQNLLGEMTALAKMIISDDY